MLIEVPPQLESLGEVNEKIGVFTEKNCVSQSLANKILLVVEEMFVNIVSYAGCPEGRMVRIQLIPGQPLKLEIEYAGKEFDPTAVRNTDVTSSLEDRQVGGLGMHLVKQMSEEFRYERRGDLNMLHLKMKGD